MNFNPPSQPSQPEPAPKKNRNNEIMLAIIIAGIAITITILAIDEANKKVNMIIHPEPTREQIMMHKCNNLQQYYGEVGVNVDIKCDKLVNALVN